MKYLQNTVENGPNETQIRNDVRRVAGARRRRVQYRAPFGAHAIRQEQHSGADQLQEQQEAARPREGVRQALQHGAGEREGNVDGAAQTGQREKEGEARE